MQLEEFLLACKKSRKTWETFGHMMKSMTRSHLSHPRDLRLSLDSGLSGPTKPVNCQYQCNGSRTGAKMELINLQYPALHNVRLKIYLNLMF